MTPPVIVNVTRKLSRDTLEPIVEGIIVVVVTDFVVLVEVVVVSLFINVVDELARNFVLL